MALLLSVKKFIKFVYACSNRILKIIIDISIRNRMSCSGDHYMLLVIYFSNINVYANYIYTSR